MFYATDLSNFLECHHLATLEAEERAGRVQRPFRENPTADLLRQLGIRHEKAYLQHLIDDDSLTVAEVPFDQQRVRSTEATIALLRSGVDVIYQGSLQDGHWAGRPDFLIRTGLPGYFGDWSYEAVDAKLARSTKAGALIQLCLYSILLSRIQGVDPHWMHVVLGGGAKPEQWPLKRYAAYFRRVLAEFLSARETKSPTYPEPNNHCAICPWTPLCDNQWRRDDSLVLVAGITRSHRKALNSRGITTVAELAGLALPIEPKIDGIGNAALRRITEQARIQLKGRNERRMVYELIEPIERGRGLTLLPPPSPGDIFFDIESSSLAFDHGLEYMFGFATVEQSGEQPVYDRLLALDPPSEKRAFEHFMAMATQRWARYPDMHIYHYAPYEPTALKRLALRYSICADDVDRFLRADLLVDLYHVVQQALRASVESYSIKRLEPLYGFIRDVPLDRANDALADFNSAVVLADSSTDLDRLINVVEGYNRDDCISTLRLRDWLEERRAQVEAATGEPLPRPEPKTGDPTENLTAYLQQVAEVTKRLTADLPQDDSQWTHDQRTRWLLAQLLLWHRREDKSAWWEYYRLLGLTDDELQQDKAALGGLEYLGVVDTVKRSVIHRYRFPLQDHAIERAHSLRDPRTEKSPGDLVRIDPHNRTIDLKRGVSSTAPHPTALIPFEVVDNKVQRDSLLHLGSSVAASGLHGPGEYRCARDLLLGLPPRLGPPVLWDEMRQTLPEVLAGVTEPIERAKRAASFLEDTVLPIQGPPGAGKTYAASRMIVQLLQEGRRIGVTAVSHKVIRNLLATLIDAAKEAGLQLRIIQKADKPEDNCPECLIQTDDNNAVLAALNAGAVQVAAGTSWLWAREEAARSVDVLFVDEAGQISLANVLAMAQASRSIVLLGDPQQLDQPQKGVHPPGADASALGHLLAGRPTISEDQGLFLQETWRLHPDICDFTSEVFYDERLDARPENAAQRLNTIGPLDGTGLRFSPVEHLGNQSDSVEEAEKVRQIVASLLRNGATWTNKSGVSCPITENEILIVAPYNAQVSALAASLPAGIRVGTVDKFQGQQAPVVIYSLATSTPDDAPRGMDFLYSPNRLNVAISRAQCVAIIVASPALFLVQCKTPRQMELANAFCRYLEMATTL